MNAREHRPVSVKSVLQDAAERFGGQGEWRCARSPGRVNLIGEHTDYNEGLVLPAAVDRHVVAAVRANGTGRCRAASRVFGETAEWDMDAAEAPISTHRWASYVFGAQCELERAGIAPPPFDFYVDGDIPDGAGLSSSAALCSASALSLAALAGRPDFTGEPLARLGREVEWRHLNVKCGIMDQMVCCLGREGFALFLDCRDLSREHVPLPFDGWSLLALDTNVKRTLAGSAYNERRETCERARGVLAAAVGRSPQTLRDVEPEEFEEFESRLSPLERKRCRHVFGENDRVAKAVQALKKKDLKAFGDLLIQSHASLRDDYEVSCPELDWLADAAVDGGAAGARMTGAGFGGCAVALVAEDRAGSLSEKLSAGYRRRFGFDCDILRLSTAQGAGLAGIS